MDSHLVGAAIGGLVFAIIVFIDASGKDEDFFKAGFSSPLMWALFTFFFGLLVVIPYFMKVKKYNAARRQSRELATMQAKANEASNGHWGADGNWVWRDRPAR